MVTTMETDKLKNINEFEDKSLLIVDDDNPFRERLARAMEKKGFSVSQAEGVKNGINSIKTKKPALIQFSVGFSLKLFTLPLSIARDPNLPGGCVAVTVVLVLMAIFLI